LQGQVCRARELSEYENQPLSQTASTLRAKEQKKNKFISKTQVFSINLIDILLKKL